LKTAHVEQVADGVWASIAEPDGGAVGNAGFVDLGGTALVFDSHVSVTAGERLRAAAETQAGPVPWLVLSHWHGDHTLGACAFDARVVATDGTRALMETRTRELIDRLKGAPASEFTGVWAELRERDMPRLELRLPDETFTGERTFEQERRARAITYGGGHTQSDAVLWLEQERTLFAGDLIVLGSHPWVGDGNVDEWTEILERIDRLAPATIVPGHGPVTGRDAIDFVRTYLDDVRAAEPGAPVPERYRELDFEDVWERNLAALHA
jgi:cyclase